MPLRSKAQGKLFRAVINNPEVQKRTGIPVKVATEYVASTQSVKDLPEHVGDIVKGFEGMQLNGHTISHTEAVKLARQVSSKLAEEQYRDPESVTMVSKTPQHKSVTTESIHHRGPPTKEERPIREMAKKMVETGEIPHHKGKLSHNEQVAADLAREEMSVKHRKAK
jgi:hypothetical protein